MLIKRLLAFIIDVCLIYIAAFIVFGCLLKVSDAKYYFIAAFFGANIYYNLCWTLFAGITLGSKILKLRVKPTKKEKLTISDKLTRSVLLSCMVVPMEFFRLIAVLNVVGSIPSIFKKREEMFWDIASGSHVEKI